MASKNLEKHLVGITEASEILGVSKSTIYRMIESGILTPAKTPGGQRRFARNELDLYLAKSVEIEAPQKPNLKAKAKKVTDTEPPKKMDPRNRINELTGSEWMPLTKSFVYQKGLGAKHPHAAIERQHPAPFSFQDVMQLIEFFTKSEMTVLDPFGGVGSTAKASALSGRQCISIELQERWHELAIQRLETEVGKGVSANHRLVNADSRVALRELDNESVDFVVTSPPYWSILNKKADHKVKRDRISNNLATNYSDNDPADLANIADYSDFNNALISEFVLPSARALRTGKYLCLIVSDFRNKSEYMSFHSDLIQGINGRKVPDGGFLRLQGVRVLLQNHKSLLPYGYPYAYVENIHHQYILVFRKMEK
jgi:excisionase family DNA binding protein